MWFLSLAFASAVSLDDKASKTRPIAKVIKMLEDMSTQVSKEAKDDADVYEKISCWCTTNDKEKTESIATAERNIAALESSIKEYAGAIAELEVKIEKVKDEYNKDWKALKSATELRMKESAKFSQEEKDFIETIGATKQAVTVLSKHHPELAQVRAAAHALSNVQSRALKAVRKPEERESLLKFLHDATNSDQATSFLSIPGFKSYSSQSGQIFGILKQMQEDFEANLSEAQANEKAARAAFKDLKAAKEEQMKAARKQQSNFEKDLAENLEKKAQAEEDLQDTEEQLSNDTKFLMTLKKRCAVTDEEYNARVKSRNEEMAAIRDTIKILDSDTSFDEFGKSLGFIQEKMSARAVAVSQAVKILRPYSNVEPRIGLIAVSAQLDAFTKVKKAIDGMIEELQAEKKDEIKHRDFCIAEFNKNERETAAKTDERDDLQAQKDQLTADIKELTDNINTLNKEIEEMKVQMSRAGDNRAKENADFQESVNDQRVTQAILQKARHRMAQKYEFMQEEPQPGAAHTALSGTKTDPGNGPARFAEYKHSGGGAKVLALLDRIIADSKTVENEAIMDEKDQQTAYEEFIKDSNKTIVSKQKSVTNKTESRATAHENLTIATGDHKQAMSDLEKLSNFKNELHGSCDFVMKNFDLRQDARDEEVKALREAKDILSGAQ